MLGGVTEVEDSQGSGKSRRGSQAAGAGESGSPPGEGTQLQGGEVAEPRARRRAYVILASCSVGVA